MPAKETVLVVDDYRIVVHQIARTLEAAGYAVVMAFNGDQALEYLKTREFDFLVTDQYMPGASGLDLVDYVCGLGSNMGVILITSSYDCRDVLDRVRAYPKAMAMIKPVSGAKLVAWLERLKTRFSGDVSGGNPVVLPDEG
jgi:DNA-binding NtrC family response regulator